MRIKQCFIPIRRQNQMATEFSLEGSEIKAHARLLYSITNTFHTQSYSIKADLRKWYHNVSEFNLNDKSSSNSQYTNNTFTHIQCSIPACTANRFLMQLILCNSNAWVLALTDSELMLSDLFYNVLFGYIVHAWQQFIIFMDRRILIRTDFQLSLSYYLIW